MAAVFWGMAALVLQGAVETVRIVCARIMKEQGLPYFQINAASCLLCLFVVSTCIIAARLPCLGKREFKWVVLRGGFGTATFIALTLAVRLGAPPGDVAAFCSINTVVAPILGRIFLGEPLRYIHGVAACCSFTGALLISKPQFLFGGSGMTNDRIFGILLAISAGLFLACASISSRMIPKVSVLWLALSATGWTFLTFCILPTTPLVDETNSFGDFQNSPWAVVAFVFFFFFCIVVAILAACVGNHWCPAFVSSTIGTTSRVVWGYLGQMAFLGHTPDLLTLGSAAVMLFGVVLMSIGLKPFSGEARNVMDTQDIPVVPSDRDLEDVQATEEKDFASFLTSELQLGEPMQQELRSRSKLSIEHDVAQCIGANSQSQT
eukprot:TRINITY_DN38187_c0_g1_i1.p1 TRINITY_DN38187_c0_g1~~TRINITY_DN38187_c0_g1_i1.p1  ORF type:complete len:393 (-),score=37.50 TRINITY_DN38187_c0_g1_i1:73-1206(-)